MKLNLLRNNKKSPERVWMGILILIISLAWLYAKVITAADLIVWDWLFLVAMIGNGVLHLAEGRGFSPNGILGKAYLEVDIQSVKFKPAALKKEKVFLWNEIISIEHKLKYIRFIYHNGHSGFMELTKLDYDIRKLIREKIDNVAHQKQIKVFYP